MAEELSTLTYEDVCAPHILELAFGVKYQPPTPLTTLIYRIPISSEFICKHIVDVFKTRSGIRCQWKKDKSDGVSRLFNILFETYSDTKQFISISHTSCDKLIPRKDLCLLRQRCAAHLDGCTTR